MADKARKGADDGDRIGGDGRGLAGLGRRGEDGRGEERHGGTLIGDAWQARHGWAGQG